jgi:glycosyltransferase involved in cell wall biosynthesis
MIARDYPPTIGGIATHTFELTRTLRALGLEVELFEGRNDFGTLVASSRKDLSEFDLLHVQSTPYGAFAKKHPLVVTAHSPTLEEKKY